MKLVMNPEELLFSIFSDKHSLSRTCIGPIIVRLIEALGALVQLLTFITTIDTLLLTACYVGAFALFEECSIRTAIKYGAASSTPFSQETVIT